MTVDGGQTSTVPRRNRRGRSRQTNPPRLTAPALPPAHSLPARRTRPALLLAGVLVVAISALGAVALLRTVSASHPFLAVARPVEAGARIGEADLRLVEVNTAPGLAAIPAGDRTWVVGRYARTALTRGMLLTRDQVTDQLVPGPGRHLLSISLDAKHLPARPMHPGDHLLLVATQDPRAIEPRQGVDSNPAAPPTTVPATVHKVGKPTAAGDVVVDVVVDAGDGPAVAALAAAGRIVLIMTTGG